jgi:uncharacterized protein
LFKKITLNNYKSFEHIEFDLSRGSNLPVKCAFIYGENGSGKSTLIESLMFLKDTMSTMIFLSTVNGMKLAAEKNKIADESKNIKNTKLQDLSPEDITGFFLFLDDVKKSMNTLTDTTPKDLRLISKNQKMIGSDTELSVSYEFILNDHEGHYEMKFNSENRLVHEKLRYVVNKRVKDIFEIDYLSDLKDNFANTNIECKFSQHLFNNKEYERKIYDSVKQYWGNHSFLSIMADQYSQNNIQFMESSIGTSISKVMDFFNDFVVSCNYSGLNSGTGIKSDILSSLSGGTVSQNRKPELMVYEKALDSFFTRIYSDVKNVHYKLEERNNKLVYSLIFSKMICGKIRDINTLQESTGTIKLLNLFPAFFECANGKTVFFDEIDSGIHDKLMMDLIEEIKGSFKGQFIVTTHNTSLLEIIEPKSVFIIRSDINGKKTITSLDNIQKTQKNHNNRSRYMDGVFDGVPIIGMVDFEDIVQNADKELEEME